MVLKYFEGHLSRRHHPTPKTPYVCAGSLTGSALLTRVWCWRRTCGAEQQRQRHRVAPDKEGQAQPHGVGARRGQQDKYPRRYGTGLPDGVSQCASGQGRQQVGYPSRQLQRASRTIPGPLAQWPFWAQCTTRGLSSCTSNDSRRTAGQFEARNDSKQIPRNLHSDIKPLGCALGGTWRDRRGRGSPNAE